MLLFLCIVFIGLLLMGMPVGFTLGCTTVAGFLYMGDLSLLQIIPQNFFSGMDLFPLMAIPFFLLAGEIMNASSITQNLVNFSNTVIGHFKGGLGHVNILASIFMAGVSGSAVADTSALGSMLIPAMKKEGFDPAYSSAVTAASSIIGPIIPPSMLMIIYGSLTGVSIAGLFAAGIIPGVGMGIMLLLMNRVISEKKNLPYRKERATFQEFKISLKNAALPLIAPVIIVGGILGGVFTPTESAAIAVGYTFFLSFFIMRTLKLTDMPEILFRTARISGINFIILAFASSLAWLLTMEQIPQLVADKLLAISTNKYLILVLINAFLLIVGLFMDAVAALIILGPILTPVVLKLGIDPLHFGVMMTIDLCLGLVTPPVGVCLFVAASISRTSVEAITKEIWPFLIAAFILLMLVTFFPALTLTMPAVMGLS